jgi:hypothetical protein
MSPWPQITIRHSIGNIIEIPNELNASVYTYLSNNFPIGTTALTVDNAIDFTSGTSILLLGSMGAENCEFGYASAHTNQGFTVTATLQPHNRGDLVSQLNYDSIEISKSATVNGTYTVLATLPIFVTQQKTIQFDPAGLTSDFYQLRWKNSVTNTFSGYSSPVSVLTYPEDSVGSLISPVLSAMGISPNDTKITTQFCVDAIDDARKYTKMKLYGTRHGWLARFEVPIQVLAGSNFVLLPSDVDFKDTDRSVLAARFITGNVLAPFNLKYIDKRSWNQVAFNVGGSITVGSTAINATTIQLLTAGDFPTTSNPGVAYVATTAFNQTTMQIQYTGVNLLTNQITGVTGVTRVIPDGTQIWVTPTIAQPIDYTVYPADATDHQGKIVFDRIIPDSMQGNNLYIDYYRKFEKITDLYQEVPEPYREIYKWYLRYAIKYRKDITLSQSDPDYVKFEALVQALFDNLYSGQDTIIITG